MVRPAGWLSPRILVPLLVACYLMLALAYGALNPLFEAPDELWHYLYVDHLQRFQTLPVQGPAQIEVGPRQEGSQPPLYYVLAAVLTSPIRPDDLASYQQLNERHRMGEVFAPDERNLVYHTEKEDVRFSRTARAVHLIRLLSSLLGALTVLLTFAVGREVFPSSRWLPLLAAALVAFLPQFVFLSGAVNNDNLGIAAATLSLWLLLRARRQPSRSSLILLGLACGAAALAKLSALSLAPIVALGITTAPNVPGLARRAANLAVVAGSALLVAGWWYGRNLLLYGDPLGLNVMLDMVGRRAVPLDGQSLLGELWLVKASFWALFGWMNVPADGWFYLVADLIVLLALAGLVLRLRALHLPERRSRELWLLGAWIVVVAAAFANWNRLTVAPQGRLLFTALPPLALLAAWGLSAFRFRRFPIVATGAIVLIGVMAGYALPAYLLPSYRFLPVMACAALDASYTQRTIDFGGQYRLLGFRLDERTLRPGQSTAVTLYWQRRDPAAPSYVRFVHLEAPGEQLFSGGDTLLGEGLPPAVWGRDDVLRDERVISIPVDADAPMLGELTVGLYAPYSQRRLMARGESGVELGDAPHLARIKIDAGPLALPERDDQPAVSFGGEIALVGHRLPSRDVVIGQPLQGTLDWRALVAPRADYTVFVHLTREGKPFAQYDGQPRRGRYPTSAWLPGELVPDQFALPVGEGVPPGEYRLLVGLYDLETGDRLPAGEGSAADLGVVTVLR